MKIEIDIREDWLLDVLRATSDAGSNDDEHDLLWEIADAVRHREAAELLIAAERIGGSPLGDRRVRMGQEMLDSMSEQEVIALAAWAFRDSQASIADIAPTMQRTGIHRPIDRR